MKHLKEPKPDIKMPFTPLALNGGQVCIIGSRPSAGRTHYALHLLQDNSLKGNNRKCLLYFISNSKKQTVQGSGFGAMLVSSENVSLNWVNFGRGDQFIVDVAQLLKLIYL